MRVRDVAVMMAASVGCGGTVAPNDAGVDATTDVATFDATDASDADAFDPCDALIHEITGQIPNALQCCPECDAGTECAVLAPGLCCPISVTNPDYAGPKIYETTLMQIHEAGCAPDCPPVTCATQATGVCIPDGTGAGQCQQ